MDPCDSPLRSPIVVPITHSPIPYQDPDSHVTDLKARTGGLGVSDRFGAVEPCTVSGEMTRSKNGRQAELGV